MKVAQYILVGCSNQACKSGAQSRIYLKDIWEDFVYFMKWNVQEYFFKVSCGADCDAIGFENMEIVEAISDLGLDETAERCEFCKEIQMPYDGTWDDLRDDIYANDVLIPWDENGNKTNTFFHIDCYQDNKYIS